MRRLVFALWCLAAALPAVPQSSGGADGAAAGVPLGVEIQNLEKTLSRTGASVAEKHDALVRLARLCQLSGNIEQAAKYWLEAAPLPPSPRAAPSQQDDAALIAALHCLGAMGEWDKAAAALKPLLAAAAQGSRPIARDVLLQAQYIEACSRLWGSAADAAPLAALAEHPDFAAQRAAICYTLWRAGAGSPAAEYWKSRLLAEFPHSPEARIAAGGEAAAAPLVSASPGMMWLLLSSPAPTAPAAAAPAPAAPPSAPAKPPAPAPAATANAAAPAKVLQAGLFSSEANARALSDKLAKSGFAPALSRKTVNGAAYWLVAVSPGADINRTIADLKKAGFDSFPVNAP